MYILSRFVGTFILDWKWWLPIGLDILRGAALTIKCSIRTWWRDQDFHPGTFALSFLSFLLPLPFQASILQKLSFHAILCEEQSIVVRHEHSPPPVHFLGGGGTAFPLHCREMFITQKCHIEEVLWGPP